MRPGGSSRGYRWADKLSPGIVAILPDRRIVRHEIGEARSSNLANGSINMNEFTTYSTIEEIELDHRSTGGKFFSASSKRFFRSRIGSIVIGGRYFITSEQFDRDRSPRLYTIRECINGSIETVGDFQGYATAAAARAAASKIARGSIEAAA